ncbi:uncharacterized protein BDR25DRAFT_270045 [Lindgomyces ingoldianus]|uniref:Uncharacterized protein n=1 Tax=Lindgomyces ingoldianus TaxID=673940 RepID=A0ACB6QH47_9PLEO|nr:uncharacterized protein BDR25DRAFT_270045 [Lindgomyces ingoldianus]KAF2465471.1 hypothetical protein BDR25DRAFT_270045 [Lindgomyces ingoldianus]
MVKGPAVVIIARHGARLDAADKTWHLTSPTPYDPPLTYGGWTQSKALGLRIAALLHARENEGEANGANPNADLAHLDFGPLDQSKSGIDVKRGKKKHTIIIHSSPYLRCIQTSTAIAAGIAQYQPPTLQTRTTKGRNGFCSQSPRTKSTVSESPAVQSVAVTVPAEDPSLEVFGKRQIGPHNILLRIDAFLGEWLTPDYYEDITPPPNSTMMVAGAKADLLRRGDYVEVQQNAHNSKGHFPGGWMKSHGTSTSNSQSSTENGLRVGLGSLAQVSPFRERASSQGSIANLGSRTSHNHSLCHSHNHNGMSLLSRAHRVPAHVYDPPVPSYAVSPSDPIPRGYVTHARDACIDVDYQWDSMRPPQEWGDGGEYGDEWSTMHRRFRKGLAGMVNWYKEHGSETPHEKIRGFTYRAHDSSTLQHISDAGPVVEPCLELEEEDEDLVLILVTHGAGCNALLGAISNQPVLLDVGMASLSMAVRRPSPSVRKSSMPTLSTRRQSVMDMGMSEEYEMKVLASLDHLRPGVDPAKPPPLSSPAVNASPSLEYRRRFGGSAGSNSPVDSLFSLGEPYRSINSSLGSMRRSSTSGSSSRLLSNNPQSSSTSSMTGLWSSLRAPTPSEPLEGRHSPGHDMVLNFREVAQPDSPLPQLQQTQDWSDSNGDANGNEKHGEDDDLPPLPSGLGRSLSQHGLWGPKLGTSEGGLWGHPSVSNMWGGGERERGPKRRWSVNESN